VSALAAIFKGPGLSRAASGRSLRGWRRSALALVVLAALGGAAPVPDAGSTEAGAGLEVTSGKVQARADGTFAVDVPEMRAVLRGEGGGDAGELRFTYRGPTVERSHLASGEVREQLGLKLRAHDGCNLVYVMWWIAPHPGIAVSVKRNPGQRTHAECGARGYENLRPSWSAAAPAMAPGSHHTLAARIDADELQVSADGAPVWRGRLPDSARLLRGPVGVRSDNVMFDFTLKDVR